MDRANKAVIACALVIGVAGSALAGQQTEGSPAPSAGPTQSVPPVPVATPTATNEASAPSTSMPVPSATLSLTPTPAATPTPSLAHPTWPPLPDNGVMPDFRSLGTFATVEEAVDAAKAAQLPAGAYGTATVGSYLLAIDGDGSVYLLAMMGGSGNGQRPPTPPKGQ